MSIVLSTQDMQGLVAAGKARYVFSPKPQKAAPEPVPEPIEPALAQAVSAVATALASGQVEQREAILRAIQVNEELVAAVQQLGRKETERPWVARITKRDTLGRIAEVEFTPK